MSIKQIMEIASNENAMELLREIAFIQSNMCFKTVYEQKTAKQEMKKLAKMIMEEVEG